MKKWILLAFLAGCSSSVTTVEVTGGASEPPTTLLGSSSSAVVEERTPTSAIVVGRVDCEADVDDTYTADLDGDGTAETLQVVFGENDNITMTVCGTMLVVEPRLFEAFSKPRNFQFTDIEGDGAVEIFSGVVSARTSYLGVTRLEDGALVDSGQRIASTVDGTGQPDPENYSFDCIDVDGDGLRELVEVVYQLDGDQPLETATAMDWTRTVLLPGGGESKVDAGRFKLPEQADEAEALIRSGCDPAE